MNWVWSEAVPSDRAKSPKPRPSLPAASVTLLVPPTQSEPPGNASLEARTRLPPLRKVAPVKMLEPERVRASAPFFTRPPAPVRLMSMTPARAVTFAAGKVPPVRRPPSTKKLLAGVRPARSSTPPVMLTEPVPRAAALPSRRLPAVTVVPPE